MSALYINLTRREISTCKGFRSTPAALFSYQVVFAKVRATLLAALIAPLVAAGFGHDICLRTSGASDSNVFNACTSFTII